MCHLEGRKLINCFVDKGLKKQKITVVKAALATVKRKPEKNSSPLLLPSACSVRLIPELNK